MRFDLLRRLTMILCFALTAAPALACPVQGIEGPPGGDAWARFKSSFVTADGRVLDSGNDGMTHSEGQGYGMLLAVARNDPAAFARLWGWTYTNLMIREDGLLVWRWGPDAEAPYTDLNSASDGDVLVAYALLKAAEAWDRPTYRDHALALIADIREHLIAEVGGRTVLLPGPEGFDREDGVILNLSYWVFPALAAFAEADPDGGAVWSELAASGRALIDDAAFGPWGLPPDWVVLREDGELALTDADTFEPVFGYNAIRVPLYLIWAGERDAGVLDRLARFWTEAGTGGAMPLVADLARGEVTQAGANPGFQAVRNLVACSGPGRGPAPRTVRFTPDTDYYAASLILLSCLASGRISWTCSAE